MATPAAIQKNVLELASRIQQVNSRNAARLKDLARAVGGELAENDWSTVDVSQVLDADAIAAEIEGTQPTVWWVTTAEWVRNALILTPVLLTWWGISRAVEAYHALLTADNSFADQTFLFLWQGGFEGRLSDLTLSRLALLDSILIGIVLALTIIAHSGSSFVERRREDALERRRHEVRDVLGDAVLCLAGQRISDPAHFVAKFDQVARLTLTGIATEQERLSQLADIQTRHLSEAVVHLNGIAQSASGMRTAAETLRSGYPELTGALQQLAGGVDEVTKGQGELIAMAKNVGASTDQLLMQQREAATDLRSASESLNATGEQLAGVVAKMGEGAEQLTRQQSALIGALREDREAQADVAKLTSSASDALGRALTAIHEIATTLNALAIETGDLSRQLPAMTEQLQDQFAGMRESQAETAREIARAANAMAAAVRDAERAARRTLPDFRVDGVEPATVGRPAGD